MFKIALQGGHLGRVSGSTGTLGEQELTRRIRTRLSELLIAKGFQLFLFDADPPQDQLNQDFDLFLALHGDMDYPDDNGSGFADYADPASDTATYESQRICKVINDVYFPETQINYVSHSNPNTRFYYMWAKLSAKTPCVLIEMGQVQDPHDKVLLANTDLIAGALSKAICKAFGVVEPTTTTSTVLTSTSSSSSTTTAPPDTSSEVTVLKEKLSRVHDIIWGKGWPWAKINAEKVLIPK